jgi:exopolyphosphatase/guanosine-5'-triphosphate,3'-diphosphate pyrophosphatase
MRIQIIVLLTFFSVNTLASECLTTRAAFDIGSGSTKMKVAQVDTCKQKIIKMLIDHSVPVAYKQALEESKNNQLPRSIINTGIMAIKSLKLKAAIHSPSSYIAVATSAFRTSANGEEAAEQIAKATGIKIKIISQKEEAKIGFVGAATFSDKDLKKTIVWDIGGGSMQITSYKGKDEFEIYEGKLAAVSFKNHIIEDVQKKNPRRITTPNPIGQGVFKKALQDAKEHSMTTIPLAMREKLKRDDVEIIGIGGVHYYSIGRRIEKGDGYTLAMLNKFIDKVLNKNDLQLGGGKYVSTDVSNAILVAGFMQSLGIKKVRSAKVNMANGLLVMPSLIE